MGRLLLPWVCSQQITTGDYFDQLPVATTVFVNQQPRNVSDLVAAGTIVPGIENAELRIMESPSDIALLPLDSYELIARVTFRHLPRTGCCGDLYVLQSREPSPLCGIPLPPYTYEARIQPFSTSDNHVTWHVPGIACALEPFTYSAVVAPAQAAQALGVEAFDVSIEAGGAAITDGVKFGVTFGILGGVLVLGLLIIWLGERPGYEKINME